MLIGGEAQKELCSVKERLKQGDAQWMGLKEGDAQSKKGLKRAMLSEGEAKIRRCSVKERQKEGDAH